MSEEMRRKKKEEEELFAKREQEAAEALIGDECPVCKLPAARLEFINEMVVKTFGWVECTRCGAIYTPKSILQQKRTMAKSGLTPTIVTPGQALQAPPL